VNYSTGTLTTGNERQVCNFHPSLDQRAPNNPIKNQKDKKTSSISTSSPLFLRLPLREKKQNPQQTQPPPPLITITPTKTIGYVKT
jgi:hypothetical protein